MVPMPVALPVKTLLTRNVDVLRKYDPSLGSSATSPAVVPRMTAVGIKPRPWTSLAGTDQIRP